MGGCFEGQSAEHIALRFPTPWNVFVTRSGLARWLPNVRVVDDPRLDRSAAHSCDWVPGCYLLTRRELVH